MAGGDERKRRIGPTLRTEFPLDRADRRQVKEWARRLAQQVADADSVEVTLVDDRRSGRRPSQVRGLQIVFRQLQPVPFAAASELAAPRPPEQPTPEEAEEPRGSGGG